MGTRNKTYTKHLRGDRYKKNVEQIQIRVLPFYDTHIDNVCLQMNNMFY